MDNCRVCSTAGTLLADLLDFESFLIDFDNCRLILARFGFIKLRFECVDEYFLICNAKLGGISSIDLGDLSPLIDDGVCVPVSSWIDNGRDELDGVIFV